MNNNQVTMASLLEKAFPTYRNGCPKMMDDEEVQTILASPDKDIIELIISKLGGDPNNIRVRIQDMGGFFSPGNDEQLIDDIIGFLYINEDSNGTMEEEGLLDMLEPYATNQDDREDIDLDEPGRHQKLIDLTKESGEYEESFDWYNASADFNKDLMDISLYYGTSLLGPNHPGESSYTFFYDPS